jgi:hypothetical protein
MDKILLKDRLYAVTGSKSEGEALLANWRATELTEETQEKARNGDLGAMFQAYVVPNFLNPLAALRKIGSWIGGKLTGKSDEEINAQIRGIDDEALTGIYSNAMQTQERIEEGLASGAYLTPQQYADSRAAIEGDFSTPYYAKMPKLEDLNSRYYSQESMATYVSSTTLQSLPAEAISLYYTAEAAINAINWARSGMLISDLTAGSQRTFTSPQEFVKHYEKHKGEFDYTTSTEYLWGAQRLTDGGSGILEYTRPLDGAKLFYNPTTNEFGILAKNDKTIYTYFKPVRKYQYWVDQTGL